MSLYHTKYTALLHTAGIIPEVLPSGLQQLIEKYGRAVAALEQADPATQERLLFILAQTDAVICAAIYSLYKDNPLITDIIPEDTATMDNAARLNKIKLLALKAKALQLKKKRTS